MLHIIAAALFGSGGPYSYLRLLTAAYAVSAVGRVIPVKRKQVPGYRRRMLTAAWIRGRARHRARPGLRAHQSRKVTTGARSQD
jgi:hypothetical protein